MLKHIYVVCHYCHCYKETPHNFFSDNAHICDRSQLVLFYCCGFVCACVRACVRACVCACVCMAGYVYVCVCVCVGGVIIVMCVESGVGGTNVCMCVCVHVRAHCVTRQCVPCVSKVCVCV